MAYLPNLRPLRRPHLRVSPHLLSRRPGGAPGRSHRRLALWGALLGSLATLVICLPAVWLAAVLQHASGGRVQLLDAQGSWWTGSALLMLTGGSGSRDALILPTRLHWQLRLGWGELRLRLQQDGVLTQGLAVSAQPGWGRLSLTLAPVRQVQWPAQWLEGLGAPWNTLKPAGMLSLDSPGLSLLLEGGGRAPRLTGTLNLEMQGISSRLSAVNPLGSYRLVLQGQGERPASLQLSTQAGALQLSGSGEIGPQGLRLRGSASAAEDQAAALNNLLNLIGRRQGAQSHFSIG